MMCNLLCVVLVIFNFYPKSYLALQLAVIIIVFFKLLNINNTKEIKKRLIVSNI